MHESLIPAKKLTYHLLRVTPQADGQFAAEPVGAPEMRVVAASSDEAIAQVREKLSHCPSSLYLVPVVPSANGSALPPLAGHAKDDPYFDAYLEEIDRYRQEVDQRECSNSSSTPTT